VSDVGVVVFADEPAGVLFDFGRGKSHRFAASPTHQIVTMTRTATQAVEDLAVLGALGLGYLVVRQRAQDAVDAGQTDLQRSALANIEIQLLGAAEVLLLSQDLQDGLLLGRGPSPPGFRTLRK
jgi:hypothetical protein